MELPIDQADLMERGEIEKQVDETNEDVVEALEDKSDVNETGIALYNRPTIVRFKAGIVIIMILGHFAGPVYLLWYMARKKQTDSTTAISVALLLTFTCTFSIVLSQFTRVKRHELLASAAAYCAVLVVFIGNAKD
ncbi:hypothetical protein IFR05_002117 [Cadophora sp. M221]|nr:hypothetical protein IFR05_002117 [Cadophora sp. M221]